MRALPRGTVTFVFTDIEGSTHVHQELGEAFVDLMAEHDRLLGAAIDRHGGTVVKSLGDGLFAAFKDASGAVRAAAAIQRIVSEHSWPCGAVLRVRVGIHTGDAEPRDGDYVSLAVHQAARVASAAHGGQVLASGDTRAAVEDGHVVGGRWRELGAYRLKGFDEPVCLVQFDADGVPPGSGGVRAVPAAAHNVPELRTTFVGRRRELQELTALLDQGQRLVTVLGPGGVGKTRLAFELVKEMAPRYTDGAWVALLANAAPHEVEDRCLRALGVPERSGTTPREVLIAALRDRRCLLLFDNCEHVADDVADVIQDLLVQCPGLVLVTTTREPLRVSGEVEWRLQPLAVDEPGGPEGDAVALFIDRARARIPGLPFSELDLQSVANICRQVDGLPLAIELAAGRLRHMALSDLAARLRDRVNVLVTTDRGIDARHSTVYALVDWSYGLLSPAAQTLLRQISLFRGSVTLEDVGAVCGEPKDSTLDQVLAELVDKSLVAFDYEATRPYRMLVTIREFARSRLQESGDLHTAQSRHAHWCARVAREVHAAIEGPRAAEGMANGDAYHDDFDAAMAHLLDVGDNDLLVGMATDLFWYFAGQGRLSEGRVWLECAAERAAPGLPRVHARTHAGQLACWQGDVAMARTLCEAGLREAEDIGEIEEIYAARYRLGHVLAVTGELDGAENCFRSAAGATSPRLRTNAANGLGTVCFFRGELDAAERHYREALATAEAAGFMDLVAVVRMNLGELFVTLHRYDEVNHLLLLVEEVGTLMRANLPLAYEIVSRFHDGRGEVSQAELYRDKAMQAARDIGDTATQQRLRELAGAVRSPGASLSIVDA